MTYIVKEINVKDLNLSIVRFITESADKLNTIYGNKFNWRNFPMKWFLDKHMLLVCFRGDEPVGFMAVTINTGLFDTSKILLRQELLYGKYPKATIALLSYFIDFGKLRANHVITCIGEHTNIKPASLERLGFTKLETLYRMEV